MTGRTVDSDGGAPDWREWFDRWEKADDQCRTLFGEAVRNEAEVERLRGVLRDVYTYLRTIDYGEDVFEQVAPLERVLREAIGID